ncbi:MAG: DUF4291 domain-containing protein [Myxococcota bacterium]
MPLVLESYAVQRERWPSEGKVILAQYDAASIVVYQAFHADTAAHAVAHGRLGGPRYSLGRMSWIKPNFLWMMYRCGWLTKDADQGRVLAIRIERSFFDALLERAVASSFRASGYADEAAWKAALKRSEVRLQWDPDHAPDGSKLARRAVQLGLRGETLERFVNDATLGIEDVSELVIAQREHRGDHARLQTPREAPYEVPSEAARRALGLGASAS